MHLFQLYKSIIKSSTPVKLLVREIERIEYFYRPLTDKDKPAYPYTNVKFNKQKLARWCSIFCIEHILKDGIYHFRYNPKQLVDGEGNDVKPKPKIEEDGDSIYMECYYSGERYRYSGRIIQDDRVRYEQLNGAGSLLDFLKYEFLTEVIDKFYDNEKSINNY